MIYWFYPTCQLISLTQKISSHYFQNWLSRPFWAVMTVLFKMDKLAILLKRVTQFVAVSVATTLLITSRELVIRILDTTPLFYWWLILMAPQRLFVTFGNGYWVVFNPHWTENVSMFPGFALCLVLSLISS